MALSSYVWFSHYGYPHFDKEFPYKRQSPITNKVKTYKDQEDVLLEIDRVFDKFQDSKFSMGRNLYFILPLFCNPKCLYQDWIGETIKEYKMSKNLNIPIARSLHEADSFIVDNFLIIDNELNSIREYEVEKNGR
tara:strand:+ start:1397 stop:1801 length:405 start_codon:yes stop_codon:yes gene_type:complete